VIQAYLNTLQSGDSALGVNYLKTLIACLDTHMGKTAECHKHGEH
jgi:hypothetical protein